MKIATSCLAILLGCCSIGCTPSFNHPMPETTVLNDSPCIEPNYDRAMAFAGRSLEILNRYDRRQEGIRYAEGTAALAIGTTAAGVSSFAGGKDLLRGLAIGGATVLGVEAMLNPASRTDVVNAGRKALYCVMGAARASRFETSTNVDAVQPLDAEGEYVGLMLQTVAAKSKESTVASAIAAQSSFLGVDDLPEGATYRSAETNVRGTSTDAETLGLFTIMNAADAQVRQEKALRRLALARMEADAAAGANLSAAVCEINDKLAAELRATAPNVQSILDSQKQRVEDQLGKVIEAEEAAEEAGEETETPSAEDPEKCGESAECKAKGLAFVTQAAAAATAPAQSVYAACINPPAAPGPEN